MKRLLLFVVLAFCVGLVIATYFPLSFLPSFRDKVFSPLGPLREKEKPLQQYAIENLIRREFQPSQIEVGKLIQHFPEYSSYQFSYTTLGKKMTGLLNIPAPALDLEKYDPNNRWPVIVLIRGYVPLENYTSGTGTKNAAAVFARNRYITFSPDFFGYGESDPESTDNFEARFQKPIEVAELLRSIAEQQALVIDDGTLDERDRQSQLTNAPGFRSVGVDGQRLGIWAHSNGGQIALTTLEILGEDLPTTLWAPVTAPFPYSILFFSDEDPDEGKAARKNVALFEKDYDVFDFSLTQHLDRLRAPLQLHHGEADEAALKLWSDEFIDKITKENARRQRLKKEKEALERVATTSSSTPSSISASPPPEFPADEFLEPIQVKYHTYPSTDHNMRPSWDTVIQRDVEFFHTYVK